MKSQLESTAMSERFERLFGESPSAVFSAPGRVNLIGEHTDYNQGFVMPSAITFRTRVAVSPRRDTHLVIQSEQYPERFELDLHHLPRQGSGSWSDYVVGVAATLLQHGCCVRGANLLVQGDIPIGAGLSSSAAIAVASALALVNLAECNLPLTRIAHLCQHAENTFVGARVGIMDPFVSCLGSAGHALLLDCRSLQFEHIPIPESVRMVVCNTMVKHQLASGEYNQRRRDCEGSVKLLSRWYPEIRALRDISAGQLTEHAKDIPDALYRRCQHVVLENERTQQCARSLRALQLEDVGQLMRASHRSLRDLYEVSCTELDVMVELAEGLPGYYGGRMTGGGFGGCTVNLVETAKADAFVSEIARRYQNATGIKPEVYIFSAANGASQEPKGKE